MTTSLKDVDSAQMVNFLASVGGFDEQYNVYGYAFYQNGKANYLVGDDYHQILQQHRESIWDKQLATPIEKMVLVDSLLSGTKDDILFKLKLKLAKQLYNRYPLAYFKEQQLLLSGKENDQGWAILKQWQQEIDGYFEAEHLLLFEEVVRMAYEKNTLDLAHCGELRSWIKQVKLQMDDNVVVKDQYCRTFWGFLRLQGEQTKLICNASEEVLYQQRSELIQQGAILSPVFYKTLWYHKSSDLSQQRTRFEKLWMAIASECQLMQRVCAILDMVS